MIVRHNQFAVFTRLARAFAREPDIRVVWDRRGKDRRQASVAADKDRRGDRDRRRDSSLTSGATDYLLLTSNEWPTYGGPARRSHEVPETSQGPEYRRLIAELDSDLDAAARSDLAVLLTGGEAEGRFTLAQCIHRRSSRHSRPFVIVDRETFTTSPVGEDRQYRTLLDAGDGGTWFIEGIATTGGK